MNKIVEAVKAAWAAPYTVNVRSGCARVYISVSGDRATIKGVEQAAKELGVIFQKKAYYGLKNALYVGYDNADGKALARGEAIAAALKASGIDAYSEAFGD